MSNLILVISGDACAHRPLRSALTKTAPECRVDFVNGIDQVKTSPRPAVILLDLMLSREPAFDVLRWLRSERRFRGVPVFVLGSETIDHDVNEAYALGANSCLLMKTLRDGFEPIAEGIATYASLAPQSGRGV